MADKRSSFKQHVRAAKEWLGEAETSLDKDEDVRGDLKLMLAQAELTRAQETKRLTNGQRWFRRLVPVFCALLLVGGVWQFFSITSRSSVSEPVPAAAEKNTTVPEVHEAPAHQSQAPEPVTGPVQAEPEPEAASVTQEGQTEKLQEIPESPVEPEAVPSRDMQKLMNAAGQSLRAQ